MNKDNIIEELNQLTSQKLINNYSIENNSIIINTLEDINIKLDTDYRTYYKLNNISESKLKSNIGKHYESFEQILGSLSDKYNLTFSKSLFDKLLELQKQQENEENENKNTNK